MRRMLLVLAVLACALCAAAAEEPLSYASGLYTYVLREDGTAEITGYAGGEAELVLPDSLDGYAVTALGDLAFTDNHSLAAVTIPAGITRLGMNPFMSCNRLTEIRLAPEHPTLAVEDGVLFSRTDGRLICYPCAFEAASYAVPASATDIGDGAFYDSRLTAVSLPEGLAAVGSYAFGRSALTAVTLPEGVVSLGDSAFSGCADLSRVRLPESLVSIGSFAFVSCGSLTQISVPAGVAHIGTYAFDTVGDYYESAPSTVSLVVAYGSYAEKYCVESGLSYFYAEDSSSVYRWRPLPDGSAEITGYDGIITNLMIPETLEGRPVTAVADRAFAGHEDMQKAILPPGITSLGSRAFEGCASLSVLVLPDSLRTVGDNPFLGCAELTDLLLAPDHPWLALENGLLYAREDKRLICATAAYGETSCVLPEDLAAIGGYAFAGQEQLTAVTIPAGVVRIGANPFVDCKRLAQIVLAPEQTALRLDHGVLFSARDNCLIACTPVYTDSWYVIPAGTAAIGDSAFAGCAWLRGIEIPDSVTAVGSAAFRGCERLTALRIPDSVAEIGANPFRQCLSLQRVQVTADSPALASIGGLLYSKADRRLVFCPRSVAGPELRVPEGIRRIDEGAFSLCASLREIILPEAVEWIGEEAFAGCEGLQRVVLPAGLPEIGRGVFRGCGALEDVRFPEGLRRIGEDAFLGCVGLQEAALPEGLERIGSNAFCFCEELKQANLPASVVSIGRDAFAGCDPWLEIRVERGSYARSWCLMHEIDYAYPDSLSWLFDNP